MRYRQLSVLSVLATAPLHHLGMIYMSSTPGILSRPTGRPSVILPWHHHRPPHCAEPHHENALIGAPYHVSDQRSPKRVSPKLLAHGVLTCAASPLQIWCTPIKGASRSARRAAPRQPPAYQLLALTS